jgi:hypothetical protein
MKTTDLFDIWERFEKSSTYMRQKGILTRTEKNWLMYSGKQWEAVDDHEGMEDLPMMNFIKPTVKYKVSSIASTIVTALYSDLNGERLVPVGSQMVSTSEIVGKLNSLFSISWEKGKNRKQSKTGLQHSAIQGDSYLAWLEGGDTRKKPQVLHNTQMHLGDENTCDLQKQPWIIIEERLDVEAVRERARLQGVSKEQIELITPNRSTEDTLLNKEEVKGKVTSLLYMEKDKKTGVVSIARCTKEVMYEKLHPVQQMKRGEPFGEGLTMYPIVPMVWEETPNSARGVSEVEQLIPNQLELNKMLARRAISGKQCAFPRLAYDDASIENPEDLNKVGAAIKLNGGNAQAIGNMVAYLAPQSMSPDAQTLCDELLNNSRTLAGASDAQLGNIDLSRVSGTAAQTVRDQQQLPLNEQQEMYQDFIENVALLWCELWKVYYPNGIEWDGISITAAEIASVEPNVRVDIAEDTSLSKMASQQELTNLFNNGKLTFEEYAEAYPEHSSIPKDVLMRIVENRRLKMEQGQPVVDEFGNPVDVGLAQGVNTGGDSGGSYQAVQSQLAQQGVVQ